MTLDEVRQLDGETIDFIIALYMGMVQQIAVVSSINDDGFYRIIGRISPPYTSPICPKRRSLASLLNCGISF